MVCRLLFLRSSRDSPKPYCTHFAVGTNGERNAHSGGGGASSKTAKDDLNVQFLNDAEIRIDEENIQEHRNEEGSSDDDGEAEDEVPFKVSVCCSLTPPICRNVPFPLLPKRRPKVQDVHKVCVNVLECVKRSTIKTCPHVKNSKLNKLESDYPPTQWPCVVSVHAYLSVGRRRDPLPLLLFHRDENKRRGGLR